jgi:hypothetical protein
MSLPADRITTSINWGKIYEDEQGKIYAFKTIEVRKYNAWERDWILDKSQTKVEKTYPEDNGYSKKQTQEVYIRKQISSENNLTDSAIFFKMLLTFEIPSEKRYKYLYLYKVRSGRIFLNSFDSGSTTAVNVNDNEFVRRGRAIKLKNNSLIRKDAPVFTLNSEGTLERRL